MDQNGRSLEIEEKVNLTFLIKKWKLKIKKKKKKWKIKFLKNGEQKRMLKEMDFCHLGEIFLAVIWCRTRYFKIYALKL